MHTLLVRILEHRQLSHAGQLFTISDYDVITDLHRTLAKIKSIFNASDYCRNANDQSVVEIVLARITAAIREMNSIETYAPALVDTLGSCLSHEMTTLDSSGVITDTPHLMTVTVPTAIRALSCGSDELTRNTTGYLSLAAIHNGRLLAQYSLQIITNILNGNFSLVRVIPQLYPENREPFHAHFPQILRLLQNEQTDQSERLSILQFASMVANANPDLILKYLDDLDIFLFHPPTRTAVLHIFLSLISLNRTFALVPHMDALRRAAKAADSDNTLATMAKIIGVIGRNDSNTAHIAVDDLITMSCRLSGSLPTILKEIESVAECFPAAVHPHLAFIRSIPEIRPSTSAVCARIRALSRNGYLYPAECNEDATVVNVADSTGVEHSDDSLVSKLSSRIDAPIISSGIRTTVNIGDSAELSAQELDKNTENLANAYMCSRLRSSCSLTNQISRSYGSLNPYIENMTATETTSRDSPLSVMSSQSNRRCDGIAFVPICPPPSYQPPKGQAVQQSNPSPLLPTAVQMGRDGRVRPVAMQQRRKNATQWMPQLAGRAVTTTSGTAVAGGGAKTVTETTFPISSGPVTSKLSTGSSTPMIPPHSTLGDLSISHTGTATNTTATSDAVSVDTVAVSGREQKQTLDTMDRSDVVRQFVDHRRSKIQNYIHNISKTYPIPVLCVSEGNKGAKHRMRVHFRCQVADDHCIYDSNQFFSFKTHAAPVWLHLMFLQMEATSIETTGQVIAQCSETYQALSSCWSSLPSAQTRNRPFLELVTSAFPAHKEQQQILKELLDARYFDSFSYNIVLQKWSCFSCNHPERARTILRPDSPHLPVLEGQLKEKRGRWKFLKRWHTKYFTLSGEDKIISPTLDLRKIRSVKSLGKGRKSRKSLPKAFEIFTDDDISYVLKANDQNKAEEWIQCLQIAVAQAHKER
uniref:PH domain-containing protein n=1 Tax=Setaria digitata TaxID=48799 RepID=A0A915PYT4_9BILA